MNVHVADADMPTLERKTDGQVGRTGAFSDSALVTHDKHFVLDPLHPLGDEPAAVPFLVLLTGFVFIADRAGPHVDAGIAAAGAGRLNDVQFTSHSIFLLYIVSLICRVSIAVGLRRHADIVALRRTSTCARRHAVACRLRPAHGGLSTLISGTGFFLLKNPALMMPTS